MAEIHQQAAAGRLQCTVVTPEHVLFDETADFVVLPMFDGELGVLPGRAALIGRLGFGELRVRKGEQTRRYYVDGGFAEIRNNVITVLTSKALPAESISHDEAAHALEAALGPTTGDAVEAQLKQQARARAQMRISKNATENSPPAHQH
jgi:F-type H+-transporting ATPase subunit epsilon